MWYRVIDKNQHQPQHLDMIEELQAISQQICNLERAFKTFRSLESKLHMKMTRDILPMM